MWVCIYLKVFSIYCLCIFYTEKKYSLHLELWYLLEKKRIVYLFLFPYSPKWLLAGFVSNTDSQPSQAPTLVLCGVFLFVCLFFAYVRAPSSPIPTTYSYVCVYIYIFPLFLLPLYSEYGNEKSPSSHRLRLLVGIWELYVTSSPNIHSFILIR